MVNLEVLLHEAEAGTASPEVVALWVGRLEEELAAGRARSEVVYLFGALLEEWARGEAAGDPQEEEARQARDRLMGEALSEAGPDDHGEVLDPLFEDLGPALAELARAPGEGVPGGRGEARLDEPSWRSCWSGSPGTSTGPPTCGARRGGSPRAPSCGRSWPTR